MSEKTTDAGIQTLHTAFEINAGSSVTQPELHKLLKPLVFYRSELTTW